MPLQLSAEHEQRQRDLLLPLPLSLSLCYGFSPQFVLDWIKLNQDRKQTRLYSPVTVSTPAY